MELLKVIGDSNVLALAALLGEEEVIKEYLDEYPNDVSYQSAYYLQWLIFGLCLSSPAPTPIQCTHTYEGLRTIVG